MQGFEEVNGTSAVPNSDIPSWVTSDADKASRARAPAPSMDVDNRFTIPVKRDNRGSVNDASSLNGEQTCESSHQHQAVPCACSAQSTLSCPPALMHLP